MAKNTGSRQPFLSLLTELTQAEQKFLVGKRDRGADLESTVRIFLEFLQGFEFFGGIDRPCVTVFGSARFKPGHRYYKMARQLGSEPHRAGVFVPQLQRGGHHARAPLGMKVSLPAHRDVIEI